MIKYMYKLQTITATNTDILEIGRWSDDSLCFYVGEDDDEATVILHRDDIRVIAEHMLNWCNGGNLVDEHD